MEERVRDAVAKIYNETKDLGPFELLEVAKSPKRIAAVARLAAEAIRCSAPEEQFALCETEAEQRVFKALFEGQFVNEAKAARLRY